MIPAGSQKVNNYARKSIRMRLHSSISLQGRSLFAEQACRQMLMLLAMQMTLSDVDASRFSLIKAYKETNKEPLHGYAADLVSALDTMDADVKVQTQPVVRVIGNTAHHMHPISFSLPAHYMRGGVPAKAQALSSVVPGSPNTYKFKALPWHTAQELGSLEREYYADMERSFFGLTWKKGGWDCLRHLELLASGCLPLFTDIASAPRGALGLYPRRVMEHLLKFPGLRLAGVPGQQPSASGRNVSFDLAPTDSSLYFVANAALLDYARRHLTTVAMAKYMLSKMGVRAPYCSIRNEVKNEIDGFSAPHMSYTATKSRRRSRMHARSMTSLFPTDCSRPLTVLFLTVNQRDNDYMADTIMHGLKELLGHDNVIDHHRRTVMYATPDLLLEADRAPSRVREYGSGFSYAFTLPALNVSDYHAGAIREAIAAKTYDLVVFGMIHRGIPPFFEDVCAAFPRTRVAAVHGHDPPPSNADLERYAECAGHIFARESY